MATVCIGGVSVVWLDAVTEVWLDSLVRACTAREGWADLCQCMDSGYRPTIYPDTRRKRALRRALVAMGYSVWPAVV